jgi:acetyl esterase
MLSVGGAADLPRRDVTERRRALADLLRFSDKGVETGPIEHRSLPGPDGDIAARLYTPLHGPIGRLPGLVFFHGGGFVAGSLESYDDFCRVLANETGCVVISVDYRLAPEHKFPAALVDTSAATCWILAHAAEFGLDPARTGVGGDSAGAVLAVGACVHAKRAGGLMPAFQFLICPITDFDAETESRTEFANGYLIDKAAVGRDLEYYLPDGVSPTDPRISPLRLPDFGGLPRAFIHTAECDPFRDEGHAYATALLDAGVSVAYTCHPGMIHLFYAMPAVIPYGRRAMQVLGTEIRTALKE